MVRKSVILLMALCLSVLGACTDEAPESASAPEPPSTAEASPSEADAREGEHVPALLGTWDFEFDGGERRTILRDFEDYVKQADRVVVRLAFVNEDDWWLGFLFDGELVLVDGVPEGDGGTYTVNGNRLTTIGSHGEVRVTYSWQLKSRELTLTAVEQCAMVAAVPTRCTRQRAKMEPLMLLVTEHKYTRSGDDVTY